MLNEELLTDILKDEIKFPLDLYSFKLVRKSSHFLIEIALDNLENRFGSVSLSDCEVLSKKLTVRLDELYPEENYTIQISSAGAERQLRLPKDLYRFKDLPMKMFFLDSTGMSRSGIFNILHLDEKEIEIQTYSGRKNPGGKKSAKKGEVFKLQISDVQRGNLYMEF